MSDAPQSGPEPREVVSSLLLGNPRPGSRTALLAARVAAGGRRPPDGDRPRDLRRGGARRRRAAHAGRRARCWTGTSWSSSPHLPTGKKGGYTGLLKVFADTIPNASLHTVHDSGRGRRLTCPCRLVEPATAGYLLTELGVRLPTASVVVLESQLDDQTGVVDLWAQANLADLHAVLASRRTVIAA